MRALLLLASFSLAACGGRVTDEATALDAAVDTSTSFDAAPPRRDSATPPPPPRDVGPPRAGCAERLSPSFMCTSPEPSASGTVCTDAMIRAFVDGCFGDSATSASCSAAQKKYPACGSCMLEDWIVDNRLAIAQCMQRIDPMSSCATNVECTYDCLDEVCASCDEFEVEDCWSNEAEGQCAATVGEYTACISDPKFSVCYPASVDDVVPFYRGACRDGGNWARAFEADLSDGGSD